MFQGLIVPRLLCRFFVQIDMCKSQGSGSAS